MHKGANYTTAFLEPHYIYIIAIYAWAFLIKWFIKFSKFTYVSSMLGLAIFIMISIKRQR